MNNAEFVEHGKCYLEKGRVEPFDVCVWSAFNVFPLQTPTNSELSYRVMAHSYFFYERKAWHTNHYTYISEEF